jgi:mgtE-like transporter
MAARRLLPGPDARQGLVALALNSSTSLVAGAVLGSLTATFERRPGLLVLVPAAIGLRGNVFGSLGNRVSTAIHAGDLQLRLRASTLLGQNVLAAGALTLGMSLVLVLMAALVSVGLGLGPTIGLADLALVSIGGGTLASLPVLAATLGLASGAVRFGWDLDNVTAPLVSTLGDVVTLPALYLATGLLGIGLVTSSLGWVLAAVAVGTIVAGARSSLPQLRRIVRSSIPVLVVAGLVSSLAGVALERRLGTFSAYPALLILVPAHLSSAGALGGILSGRLSSQLLLGLAPPTAVPARAARRDLWFVAGLSLPVFVANGAGAHLVAGLLGEASPGLGHLVAASVLGGAAAMLVVLVIAYYGTIATVRLGIDPDTYGIPRVSSTVDLVGALTLIVAIATLGLT